MLRHRHTSSNGLCLGLLETLTLSFFIGSGEESPVTGGAEGGYLIRSDIVQVYGPHDGGMA